jgi:hypothetical protein
LEKIYFEDLKAQLSLVGIEGSLGQGNIAKDFGSICKGFPEWKIGVLQSTKDIIMSIIFGNISQQEHSKLVMSTQGISELARVPQGQCSVWIHNSPSHTFIGSNSDLTKKTHEVSAQMYLQSLFTDDITNSTIP